MTLTFYNLLLPYAVSTAGIIVLVPPMPVSPSLGNQMVGIEENVVATEAQASAADELATTSTSHWSGNPKDEIVVDMSTPIAENRCIETPSQGLDLERIATLMVVGRGL